MRRCLTHAVFAVGMSLSFPALAQNCPPGAWFCEETEVPPPPPAPPKAVEKAPALPPPAVVEEEAEQPAAPPAQQPRVIVRRLPPPVVVYQPAPYGPPPRVVIIAPGYGMRPIPAPPPPPRPRWTQEWGLNLRLEGLVMGHPQGEGPNNNTGMGGIGLSLRYRPVPAFAFDLGVDLVGGTDYNGFQRTETPVSLSGMIYVNPKSRVQFYLIGGVFYSHANVQSEAGSTLLPVSNGDGTTSAQYDYFGGQGGLGLEFRLSHHVALDVDGIGFMRTRTDSGLQPEFYNPSTGQSTNTSGGGLFRGGLTFWW